VNVRLKVANSDGIVNMVENNIIDLGVVESPVNNKNLAVEVCRMDQLVGIVPPNHPLASDGVLDLSKIIEFPYICREEGSGTRDVISEHLKEKGINGVDLDISMELGSPEAVKGAVEAGMGISIVSRATITKELQLGTLVALPLNPPLERPFSFVHQKQKFRLRAMDELLEFARNYCREHQAAE
jgi:DNA-binding transcriptional LysR family regulator